MNWLDRSIAFVAPAAGLRRARNRAVLDLLSKRYASGTPGRGSDRNSWARGGAGPNAALAPFQKPLRERARRLYEDNPQTKKAVQSLVGNCIGWGIRPRAKTGRKALDKMIDDAWSVWCSECDADGQLDFYGLQALAVRTTILSGEVLLRFRPRRPRDGLLVPLQLQLMEPDHIDDARTGDNIIRGIQFDAIGRRELYWLFPQHPGEAALGMPGTSWRSSAPVPAWQILHLYAKERPGLVRGVPWLHTVINKLRSLDDYDAAELMRKNIEACLAAFVIQEEGSTGRLPIGDTSSGEKAEASGARLETFEPGMIEYLRPGEDVKFNEPRPGGGYRDFMDVQQHAAAAGIGVTYEQFTGDLSRVNWSSFKAGAVEFQRQVETFRWLTLTPMLLDPVWRWFIDFAFAAGVIPEQAYGHEWSAPPFQSIEPAKEIDAKVRAIRAGLKTPQQAVAEEGYDFEGQIDDYAEAFKILDAKGVKLDSDPRSPPGGAEPEPPPEADAEADEDKAEEPAAPPAEQDEAA